MIIDVSSLKFTYPGQATETLKGLDFQIEEGESFGFLGPSGSGKSTTQKLLMGLLKGHQGRLQILGKEASEWGPEIYKKLGVGFELPNHFTKLTGLENLQLFASFYGEVKHEPMALLKRVGLEQDADKRVQNYSKGMAMRLNFVRAIMHDPDLLFLDEPTAGLDPANARLLKDIILELKDQGKTIFLTTHNMHDADELCDRVAFLNEGQIELMDSPHALKLAHGQKQVAIEYMQEGETQKASFELKGLYENETFMKLLQEDAILTMHSQEATLEDVFIKTTGRALR